VETLRTPVHPPSAPEARPRSAPAAWGDWPPAPDVLRRVVERAARQLAALAAEVWAGETVVLLADPHTPAEVDLQYAPTSAYAPAGRVLALGRRTVWVVHWDPATGAGFARRTFDHTV
jgi:hypothetical protein